MIIFYRKNSPGDAVSLPVALLDASRSDDVWSIIEITKLTAENALRLNIPVAGPVSIFPLDYSVQYRHSGVRPADALKTAAHVTVSNAPAELVSLVQLKQIVGQESVMSLQNAVSQVVDPQVQFAYAVMIFKVQGPLGISQNLVRDFIVYGTVYNFDAKRINSTLEIKGAAYDSLVMRLQLKFNIVKTEPLLQQIQQALSLAVGEGEQPWQVVTEDPEIEAMVPLVERYYPPAPLNKLLANLCRDNSLWFDISSNQHQVIIKSLSQLSLPKDFLPTSLSFRGTAPGGFIIGDFSVRDYATAHFKTEAFDLSLFDQLTIYNDSKASELFGNFRKAPLPPLGFPFPVFPYAFYVLEYQYIFNSVESAMEITATNNWLVSNFKWDAFFENVIYAGSAG